MKRILGIILCIICLFSIGGCGSLFVDNESEIYSKTVYEFLDALDNKDTSAIYNLFSASVQKDCNNLKEKIEELVLLYKGTTERIGDISSLAGDASYEDGNVCKNAYTTFPIFSNGKYFWIHLDLMYENTLDENQIGITKLDFLTADAYYDIWSSENHQEENIGLNIFNKNVKNYNIISINNYPYNYIKTKKLNLDEVKSFFKNSTSMNAFIEKFGQPSSSDEFGYIYPLFEDGEEELYLYISCEDDKIIYSDVLSNFAYIDKILDEQ